MDPQASHTALQFAETSQIHKLVSSRCRNLIFVQEFPNRDLRVGALLYPVYRLVTRVERGFPPPRGPRHACLNPPHGAGRTAIPCISMAFWAGGVYQTSCVSPNGEPKRCTFKMTRRRARSRRRHFQTTQKMMLHRSSRLEAGGHKSRNASPGPG